MERDRVRKIVVNGRLGIDTLSRHGSEVILAFYYPSLLVLAVLLVCIVGCREDVPETGDESDTGVVDMSFTEPLFSGGRLLDTLLAMDLDDDGLREYIVTSIERQGTMPANARADQLEIYKFDTATRKWKPIITDTLFWAIEYDLEELTGDRASELIVSIFGGGNDPVTSSGLVVYSGHNKRIRKLLEQEEGAPRVEQIDGSELPIILLHSEFWPEFIPRVEATIYVSDLLSLVDGNLRSVSAENLAFFRKEADYSLKSYRESLKETISPDTLLSAEGDREVEGSNLYVHAAETIIALDQMGEMERLRFFWHRQQDTLRRLLSEEEFDVLKELYAENIMR